jgi:hypothetical protein
MKGEVDKVVDVDKLGAQAQEKFKELGEKAKDLDIDKLGAQAQGKLKELTDKAKEFDVKKLGAQVQEKLKGRGSTSSGGSAKEGADGRARAGGEAVGKRTKAESSAARDEPRRQP